VKRIIIILVITLCCQNYFAQKTEVEFGLSIMESSYGAREYGEYGSMHPVFSKGGAMKLGSNILVSVKDSSKSVFVLGVDTWWLSSTTIVKESEFRDNGYYSQSFTEGNITTKQFAITGKLGVEFRNKKNTLYSQVTLLSQYYFKSKNEGRLSTRWTLHDFLSDTITTGSFSEDIETRLDYYGSLMNIELKLGMRLPLKNKQRLGTFVFVRLRNRKWESFVRRERFGAGISFMF